ncbi:MAG: T9SS type A sorting domain-containing protein [Gilvibacter sp.]
MKRFLLLLTLWAIPFISQAQVDFLFENDWFLIELNIDGVNIPIPDNAEVALVPAVFSETSDPDYFETSVCNWLTADILADFEQITFSNIVVSLIECTIAANTGFEFDYFPFFAAHDDAAFDYSISIIDGPETGDYLLLHITNPDGDNATYTNKFLSIPESNLSAIKLYPNPTSDILNWSNPENRSFNVSVYSAQGKLVLSEASVINSIDVAMLPSGLYFLEISDGLNRSQSKFIKR